MPRRKLTELEKMQIRDAKKHQLEISNIIPRVSELDSSQIRDAKAREREEAKGRSISMQRPANR